MANPFVQSMAGNFEVAFRLMEAALTDCPDILWETDLWPQEAPMSPTSHGGLHGSAPWFLGYHALLTLDYDLTGEFESWAPPKPFDENTYAFPDRVFTKTELLRYINYCRARLRRTLIAFSQDVAARPLPDSIDTTAWRTECSSAPCRCTSSSTPPRFASSSPPPESLCNPCPAIVGTQSDSCDGESACGAGSLPGHPGAGARRARSAARLSTDFSSMASGTIGKCGRANSGMSGHSQ